MIKFLQEKEILDSNFFSCLYEFISVTVVVLLQYHDANCSVRLYCGFLIVPKWIRLEYISGNVINYFKKYNHQGSYI